MRASGLWQWSALRLEVVAGLVDGILTALTLGAAHLLPGAPPMAFGLALRVAVAAALSGAFIFLVAHYADLRSEFIDAERQLNLLSHGQLASSQLGRAAFREAAVKALVASAATFVGAMLPVSVSAAAPSGDGHLFRLHSAAWRCWARSSHGRSTAAPYVGWSR